MYNVYRVFRTKHIGLLWLRDAHLDHEQVPLTAQPQCRAYAVFCTATDVLLCSATPVTRS